MAALFFDLDGTLLCDGNMQIPQSAVAGLRKAKENGHQLFVNTGRTPFDIPDEIKAVGFDGYCCGCGTHLEYQGEVLFSKEIPAARREEIVEWVLKTDAVEAVLEGVKHIYFQKGPYEFERMEEYRRMLNEKGRWDGSTIGDPHPDFTKVVFYEKRPEDTKEFWEFLSFDLDVIQGAERYYECVLKGYSKATAIAYFQEKLKLTLDDIYVFGDSGNDLTMFAYAKHTIAMKKHEKVLDPLTEYVTDTAEQDGIYKALEHYGLI